MEEEADSEGLQHIYAKLWAKRVYDHAVPSLCAHGIHLIIPHTVIFSCGVLQAWYFTTRKGNYRRKCLESNVHNDIMHEFCRNKSATDVVAQLTTQTPSSGVKVVYFTAVDLRTFLLDPEKGSGILQSFVAGEGEYLKAYQVLWTPLSAQIRSISSQHKCRDSSKPLDQRLGTYDAVDYETTPLKVQVTSHTYRVLKAFTQLLVDRLNKIAAINQAEREHSHTKIIENVRYGIFNFRITDSRVYFLGNTELQICIMSYDDRAHRTSEMVVSRRVLKLEDYGKSEASHRGSLIRNTCGQISPAYDRYVSENFATSRPRRGSEDVQEKTAWTLELIHDSLKKHGGWRNSMLMNGAEASLDELKALLFAADIFVTPKELEVFAGHFPCNSEITSNNDSEDLPQPRLKVSTQALLAWLQTPTTSKQIGDNNSPVSKPKSNVSSQLTARGTFPAVSEARLKVFASLYQPTFEPKTFHAPNSNPPASSSIPQKAQKNSALIDNETLIPKRPSMAARKPHGPREIRLDSSAYVDTHRDHRLDRESLLETAKKFLNKNVEHYLCTHGEWETESTV